MNLKHLFLKTIKKRKLYICFINKIFNYFENKENDLKYRKMVLLSIFFIEISYIAYFWKIKLNNSCFMLKYL